MQIKVDRPGLLTTVQDLGRRGYQKYGIIASGVMDSWALRIGNAIVGNKPEEASLEITMSGPVLDLPAGLFFSLTGGDLQPQIEGISVPMWRPIHVKKNCQLRFGHPISGCRSYMTVSGGFNVADVMGSKSTYLRAAIGGFQGRALQKDDILTVGSSFFARAEWRDRNEFFSSTCWYVPESYLPSTKEPVRVRYTLGGQWNAFSEISQQDFSTAIFSLSNQSDRMGYRLAGPKLMLENSLEMISEAVAFGTVQVPPDGNPIILMADRQTAGGYPKIGQIVLADLPKTGQLSPGSKLCFSEVSLQEAENLYLKQEEIYRYLLRSIAWNLS
jgi:antagonist of KipI